MTLKIDVERLSLSLRCFCRFPIFAFAGEIRLYIVECLCSDIVIALLLNIAYDFFEDVIEFVIYLIFNLGEHNEVY